jgi:drug/metabolite transporter (DMT)-like permease
MPSKNLAIAAIIMSIGGLLLDGIYSWLAPRLVDPDDLHLVKIVAVGLSLFGYLLLYVVATLVVFPSKEEE